MGEINKENAYLYKTDIFSPFTRKLRNFVFLAGLLTRSSLITFPFPKIETVA